MAAAVGTTLLMLPDARESGIRRKHHITVVGIKRRGEELTYATQDTVVRAGDLLIVSGRIDEVEAFASRT